MVKISGEDMTSIFLTKGNLRLGLYIGLISFFVSFILAILYALNQNIGFEKFISLTPIILVISLADGFMEELLFRGLFLKRFKSLLGVGLSIFLTSLIFALTHVQVKFSPSFFPFLIAVFLFGLLWGYIT